MTISRDVSDISTDPGGKSGQDWTSGVRGSVAALWGLQAGVLQSVSGTNAIEASLSIDEGFSALADGMEATLIPANTNTGAVTLDIEGTGAKSVLNKDGDALNAGDLLEGGAVSIKFIAGDDAWRVLSSTGTTNVTLQGGKVLKRSAIGRLPALAGPTTDETSIGSRSFSCSQNTSRVLIEGAVCRVLGAGSGDADGLTISLYVDGSLEDSFTDYALASSQANTPVQFEYEPGNTGSHTYEIRAECTIAATYPAGSNFIVCTELAPNA